MHTGEEPLPREGCTLLRGSCGTPGARPAQLVLGIRGAEFLLFPSVKRVAAFKCAERARIDHGESRVGPCFKHRSPRGS